MGNNYVTTKRLVRERVIYQQRSSERTHSLRLSGWLMMELRMALFTMTVISTGVLDKAFAFDEDFLAVGFEIVPK